MDIFLFTAMLFTAAGLILIAGIPALESYRIFCAGTAVDAVVHERKIKWGKVYLTWTYTIDGTSYFYPAKRGRKEDDRQEGDHGAVLVQKGNPLKVYELSRPESRTVMYVAGGLLLVIAIAAATAWMYRHGMINHMILL